MDRRFFTKLLSAGFLTSFIPSVKASKISGIWYATKYFNPAIIGQWVHLSDKHPTAFGYKIDFQQMFEQPFREEPNYQWIITYPDGTTTDISWAITFTDDEILKEQEDLIKDIYANNKVNKIIHQLHLQHGNKHKLLVVFDFDAAGLAYKEETGRLGFHRAPSKIELPHKF